MEDRKEATSKIRVVATIQTYISHEIKYENEKFLLKLGIFLNSPFPH